MHACISSPACGTVCHHLSAYAGEMVRCGQEERVGRLGVWLIVSDVIVR